MPVSEQPGRKYVPRRRPASQINQEPEYRCLDLKMTRAEVIARHLQRIATRSSLEATKAQIAKILEYTDDALCAYITEPDSFYNKHVSAFDQLLKASYDYLSLTEYRGPQFAELLGASAYWNERYEQVHTWFIDLLNAVQTDTIVQQKAETEEEKERQSVWLKFCLFREKLKRLGAKASIGMWVSLPRSDLQPILPVLKTVVTEMSATQREYMETLFMFRPVMFIELFDLLNHEAIVYTGIDMIKTIFDIPRVYSLDCIDECTEVTGLNVKDMIDAITSEARQYLLSSPGKKQQRGKSDVADAPAEFTQADLVPLLAEMQRFKDKPALLKKRLEKLVDDPNTVSNKIWMVLKPRAEDLGLTWKKLESAVGSNYLDVIAPRIQSLIENWKQAQKPEDRAKFDNMMQYAKTEMSDFTNKQAQAMGMQDEAREEAKRKVDQFFKAI